MAPVAYKTCDICRKRKTKCIPATESAEGETGTSDPNAPCTNCTRLQIACTYDHKYKKPGRPSSFAKAAAERDGRSSDSVEPVDAHRRPADTGQRGDESWGGMGMGARIAGNGAMSTTNGTGMAHGGVSAVRSQSFGEAATPSSRPLPGDVDPSQQSLRRLSEVALRRPTEQFLTSTSPFRAPRGLAPTLLIEGEGGSAGMDHAGRGPFVPGPGQSTATVNASATAPSAPSYTAIPFGPIPNSLAPAYLLPAPPGPAQSNGLTNIDDFDFASAFHHPYDDHDHEDGAENDLAIDWPTMSSGNGTGAAGNATHPGAGVGAGGAALQMALQQDGTAQGGSGGSHPHERTRPNTHTFSTGFSPAQQPGLATLLEQPGGPGTSQLPSVTLQPPSSTTSSIPRPRIRDSDREFQIEDIVPWHTISFFITIYLGYSHSLFPMVHRPSFSQKLALRVDKRDKDFRALVLGIVAYTIGQSPLSRMTGSFTRPELSALQHRCHRGSMMLLDRSFRDPNVLQVATLSAGYFYCQSVGKTTRALTLLSECCQLMHLLHMHDDDATASMGLDAVEIQMRRRIWWHVYAVDITEASAGQMIHLNSFEGQPSFPSEIDDEYLTAQGSFPQPPTHTSYIVGLVACVRLFPVLEQVLVRSRSLRTRNKQARYMTHAEIAQEIEWIAGANAEVDGIMDGLPDVLKMGWAVEESMDEIRLAVMGMQRANMAITAVSIRFALADYKAELQPQSHSADADSASMGREAYHTLSIIPLDDLAANGESMRGKIFRILLALLKSNSDSTDWVATLQDWWTLFSRVQFVQLMTSNVESRLPSPEPGAAA